MYITPKQVTREYLPSHQPWTSTDTPLQFNPSAMSSYRPEGKGLDKALDNLLLYTDPPRTIHHYLDNEAILKSATMPERNKKARHDLRENEHYTLSNIREKLKKLNYYDTNPEHKRVQLELIKGHSGNKLHELADRHAARIAFRHTTTPQRFPANDNHPFYLYFCECLVEEDIRAHVQLVCKEVWKRKWREHTSQGRTARLTEHVSLKLPQLNTKSIKAWDSKLYAKSINNITHCPYRMSRTDNTIKPTCPLCGADEATEDHILFECPHEHLRNLRTELDTDLENATFRKADTYYGVHPRIQHPIELIPTHKLYPYAIHHPPERGECTIEALPESRWYRTSRSTPHCITIQCPPRLNDGDTTTPKQVRIPKATFWNLIAWHKITHH